MKFRVIYILLVVCLSCYSSGAQTKEDLQDLIKRAQQEIELTNELIQKAKKDQKASENELKLVRTQISNRKEMLTSLGKQINLIDNEITLKNSTIGQLNKELEQLKKDYAEMIYSAYKNYKLNNYLLFIYSSEDFNDATKRIDYMRRYNQMREEKARQIREYSDSILLEVSRLDQTRTELDETKETRNTELASLSKDENQYRTTLSRLKTQETNLNKELKAKQDEIDKAQKRIQELIAEEARRNREAQTTVAEDRQLVELSGRFEQNKGKLPYPVSGGVVIDKFGEHAHSVVKTSKIVNKGVNIAASKGAEVRCVFDGVVTAIFNASVLNNCIIVRHGDYVTVYANVVTVSVKTGDNVSLNQRLGKLPDTDDTDTHFLHFEVLENGEHVNPEHWIKR